MTSTPKPLNGNATSNGHLGKRKKSRETKGSYLSKWLDKTLHHIQESTPSMNTYDSYLNSNWPVNNMHCPPNFDPCRFNMYGGYAAEPMSLPTIPTYYNNSNAMRNYYPDYRFVQSENKSIQVQRPRQRRRNDKAEDVSNTVNGLFNTNYLQSKNFSDSQDFASLPPIVTSVGDTTSNSDLNMTEKEGNNNRRFSDPCEQGIPDVTRPVGDEVEAGSDISGLSGSHVGSKLLSYLLDQITTLKMANERLNKDLQDTKSELQMVKQQNAMWQKGTATLGVPASQPSLNMNGVMGAYSPGAVTDVVRELREAARVREEALYSRMWTLLVDKNDNNGLNASDSKYSDRHLEEIKNTLRASEADKRRMHDRITKLEDELRNLRVTNGLESTEINGAERTEDSESEKQRLRKDLAEMRRAKHQAEERSLKLERLVTQLKFNNVQISTPNGPESLASSETDHEANSRARRTSVNSTNNSTVVFGPVTDL